MKKRQHKREPISKAPHGRTVTANDAYRAMTTGSGAEDARRRMIARMTRKGEPSSSATEARNLMVAKQFNR